MPPSFRLLPRPPRCMPWMNKTMRIPMRTCAKKRRRREETSDSHHARRAHQQDAIDTVMEQVLMDYLPIHTMTTRKTRKRTTSFHTHPFLQTTTTTTMPSMRHAGCINTATWLTSPWRLSRVVTQSRQSNVPTCRPKSLPRGMIVR